MIDEAAEQREEELAERDRIGEKSPSEDAAFGGRGPVGFIGPGPLIGHVVEGEPQVEIVEPDASNAKCMVRGHDFISDADFSSSVDAESPTCARCRAPNPNVVTVTEPKGSAHIPREVAAWQARVYRGLMASLRRRR